MKLLFYIIFAILLLTGSNNAQTEKYYFYHPEIDYGSELVFSPVSTFLNGSFDVLRNGGHENNGETIDVFRLDYSQGMANVWANISNPFYHINNYGWDNFLGREVIPRSLDKNEAQWIPNYGHHILGGGMLYVKMAEWFDYHGFDSPYLTSLFTSFAYQFVNEALENNHTGGTNVDPIADLLIFNPLGYLLFSFDSVKEFFSETVTLHDWSLQPVFNPFNNYLENAGQQFAFKYQFSKRYSAFFYYGIYGIGGLSYTFNDGYNFSFGMGTVVNRLDAVIINDSRYVTPKTDGALGFFYDRNHSLMASVIITGPRMYNARINVYPGFAQFGWFNPGMYLGFGEWDNFLVGITFARFPVGVLGGLN